MKKLFLLAAISLLLPSIASAITPRPGHYGGSGEGAHVTFILTEDGRIADLKINSHQVGLDYYAAHLGDHHTFRFSHNTFPTGRYTGHGVWFEDGRCHGDFRRYPSRHSDANSYHTWHARWTGN